MKSKVSVVQVNGKWCFEKRSGKKRENVFQTEFSSKELAEEFLTFYNKYFYKKVIIKGDEDITIPVRCTEISFRYDQGEDNPPTKILGIRFKNAKWFVKADRCELVAE